MRIYHEEAARDQGPHAPGSRGKGYQKAARQIRTGKDQSFLINTGFSISTALCLRFQSDGVPSVAASSPSSPSPSSPSPSPASVPGPNVVTVKTEEPIPLQEATAAGAIVQRAPAVAFMQGPPAVPAAAFAVQNHGNVVPMPMVHHQPAQEGIYHTFNIQWQN